MVWACCAFALTTKLTFVEFTINSNNVSVSVSENYWNISDIIKAKAGVDLATLQNSPSKA